MANTIPLSFGSAFPLSLEDIPCQQIISVTEVSVDCKEELLPVAMEPEEAEIEPQMALPEVSLPTFPRISGLTASLPGRRLDGRSLLFLKKIKRYSFDDRSSSSRYATPIYQTIRELELQASRPREELRTGPRRTEQQLLWVDKYAPQKFTDLVSPDKANVEVLKWVGQWRQADLDLDRRPEKKIMLIHGPPGLGKTTLAQVVASVTGHQLIEINASDDRSGEAVIQRVKSAVTGNSIASGRPNLLLIDEIDGAASNASETNGLISFLVQLANAKGGAKPTTTTDEPVEDEAQDQESAKRTKKKGPSSLRRPIICICNDLYAPALKALRLVAQIVMLKAPSPLALSQRLRAICDQEGFRVDGRNLVDLCEAMDGDMRACLHALQQLSAARKQIAAPGEMVRLLQDSGLKDVRKSNFSLLRILFGPRSKDGVHAGILQQLSTAADEVRVLEGCHELYLRANFFDDPVMGKVNAALDWLGMADNWSAQQMPQYAQYAPLRFNRLFGGPTALPNFTMPKEAFEASQRQHACKQILASYLAGLPPVVRASWGPDSCLLDRAPFVLPIIKPSLKTPNPQLLKPAERLHLDRIVRVMANEGLTYREAKISGSEAGSAVSYGFPLEPPIDLLVKLINPLAPDQEPIPSHLSHRQGHEAAVRKLVAHEIRQAVIKQRTGLASSNGPTPSKRKLEPLALPQVKAAKLAEVPVKKDFFGRPIRPKEPPVVPEQAAESKEPAFKPIFFKYNEGVTNAIRRTIRIRDLFPSLRTDSN